MEQHEEQMFYLWNNQEHQSFMGGKPRKYRITNSEVFVQICVPWCAETASFKTSHLLFNIFEGSDTQLASEDCHSNQNRNRCPEARWCPGICICRNGTFTANPTPPAMHCPESNGCGYLRYVSKSKEADRWTQIGDSRWILILCRIFALFCLFHVLGAAQKHNAHSWPDAQNLEQLLIA